MRLFFSFILCLALIASLVGQTSFPYELQPAREVALLAVGGGISVTAHLADRNLNPLNVESIGALDVRRVGSFDRGATRQYSPGAADWSNHLLRGAVVSPLLWASSRTVRRRAVIVGTMLAETMLLQDGLTKSTKLLFKRPRPYLYNDAHPLDGKLKPDARLSFFSGHTSATAALSFFSAQVFADVYPESRWKPVVWGAAALLPAATGYARYRAGKHFPTDILAGYAVGAGLGILIPRLHRAKSKAGGFSMRPVTMAGGAGVHLQYRW